MLDGFARRTVYEVGKQVNGELKDVVIISPIEAEYLA